MDERAGYAVLRMEGEHVLAGSGTDVRQLNYLTKYLELLDTIFLVLKKKPLSKLSQVGH